MATRRSAAAGQRSGETVALVLAGGGARGAYELGVLSVLAPVLEARGERLQVLVGTSVGALNAAYLGASAHLPLVAAIRKAEDLWRSMRYRDVLSPLLSLRELGRAARYLGELAGVPGASVSSLLDPAPLRATLEHAIDFGQLEANVASGSVKTIAVVATSFATSRSVVFHRGGVTPPVDDIRAIDYVPVSLGEAHVRASAAIPGLFPAVEVDHPKGYAGWYADGGTRLNAPLQPALAFGAERVIVIGMNSSSTAGHAARHRPDAIDGAAQLAQIVLADQLTDDVDTLASINETLMATSSTTTSATPGSVPQHRRIPYVFVSPPDRFTIGRLAVAVYQRHYSGLRGLVRSRDLVLLAEIMNAERSPIHGELLSYLFFAPEFIDALVEQGRRDARRWIEVQHDDGLWRYGRWRDAH